MSVVGSKDYMSVVCTPIGRGKGVRGRGRGGYLSKQSLSGLLFNIKRYKWEGAGVYCVGWGLE